jgi:anaerobic selenocysteine-containing dehydrogenase
MSDEPVSAAPALRTHPDPADWDDYRGLESAAWPAREAHHYWIIPSICFNCEAACGLIAYVDKQTREIRKVEGNPLHPASRGRTCAKGVVTVGQLADPERILYPLKRTGPRGSGQWRRTTWDEVLDQLGTRIRNAIIEKRHNEVMYHVGRPGEDGYVTRVLQAWGIDGHNSHTNVCSSSARLGHFLWTGSDRPSPDHAHANVILLMSSHLETGHYFNPHAQRIMEGKARGATLIVIDPRLSNTSAHADMWLPAYSGTEGALLLAIVRILLEENLFDREFVRQWVNWRDYLEAERPDLPVTFESFVEALKQEYARFTPEFAEGETGVPAAQIIETARVVGRAGNRLSTHCWRGPVAGHLWGWQIARALYLVVALTGSVATEGGTNLASWNKFVPAHPNTPPPFDQWNELLFPREYPLAFHEMSFLLPHFLKERRGKLDVYFTRAYNPVWTNPDGFSWMEVLQDESMVGLHAAMTPIWNETAWFADFVLPMGFATERHDTLSYETHAARWLGFRQPVRRVAADKAGTPAQNTCDANPGEVWEESEFWIALSWRIDPDGSLGIRQYFESPNRPGEPITLDEYYGWMFDHSVPGLPERAAREGLTALAFMRKYGAFEVEHDVYRVHERPVPLGELALATVDRGRETVSKDGRVIGILAQGVALQGFNTPSHRLEFHSATMREWGWPEHAVPGYWPGHVHWKALDRSKHEFDLLPNFRLPTQIHTRAPSKWLHEISHNNPLWLATPDARDLGIDTGDLVKITTRIGYFVTRAWVTEGIRPGVVAMSHHMGRWRLEEQSGVSRVVSSLVRIEQRAAGQYLVRQVHGSRPFESADPDTSRIWWSEVGVHQNLTFPVQPDPVSGMHCWHQRVTVERAGPEDAYGDIFVDTAKSHSIYREWLEMTRPAPGPDGTRRPAWFDRPLRPTPAAYKC